MKLAGNAEYCVFTNGRTPIPLSEAKWQKNAFHVFGSWDKRTGKKWTTTNDDIVVKNYLIMDIDIRDAIRQKEKRKIEQSEVIERCEAIKVLLSTSMFFADWSVFVCTGNWCQIYYVWDNAVLEDYYDWMEVLMQEFDEEILKDTPFETDKSMKNLARLARLPWTINSKPDKARYNWDQKCDTLWKQEKHSILLKMLSDLAEQERERQAIEAERKAKEYEENAKNYRPKENWSVYDAIEEISTAELFQINRGLELARDWKNFISDKDGCFISAFYDKERNLLHFQNPNSRHNKSGQTTFWPRTYIKYEILGTDSDQQIFERAKSKYPHLRDLDDKNVKAYKEKEKQKIMEKPMNEVRQSDFSEAVDWLEILWYFWVSWMEDKLGYIYQWDFCILWWYQYSWKTAFAHNMCLYNASNGIKTMFYTLEMSTKQILLRNARAKYWVEADEFALQKKNHPMYAKIKEEYERQQNIENYEMIWLPDAEDRFIDKLIEHMKQKMQEWVQLFVIDSLWKIKTQQRSEVDAFGEISDKFRTLMTYSPSALVVIHHMWKPSKKEWMKKPWGIAWLRWTHKVSDDATKIMEYWRPQFVEQDSMVTNESMFLLYKDTIWEKQWCCQLEYSMWEFYLS